MSQDTDEIRSVAIDDRAGSMMHIDVIGYIKSPFAQKFAVPRQPVLCPSVISTIHFYPPYSDPRAFEGLEGFSHIHVLFLFDRAPYDRFKATVRPPRLGGNTHVGVFASRSPFRPSRIGLSVVRLLKIEVVNGKTTLVVSGADLVDNTPIIDIKPYIPFVDIRSDATGGYASSIPPLKDVEFACATDMLNDREIVILKEILAQDPRPAYKGDDDAREYQTIVLNLDIRFKVRSKCVTVTQIKRIENGQQSI